MAQISNFQPSTSDVGLLLSPRNGDKYQYGSRGVPPFPGVFKYAYLKGKVNKRVDNCLVNLLKYVRDKYVDRLIKLTKGKNNHRQHLINDRHKRSLSLPTDKITETNDSTWDVLSEDNEISHNISHVKR